MAVVTVHLVQNEKKWSVSGVLSSTDFATFATVSIPNDAREGIFPCLRRSTLGLGPLRWLNL